MLTCSCCSSKARSCGPKVQTTSSTFQPSPWASMRGLASPRPPFMARRANACSNSTAIFPKNAPPASLYKSPICKRTTVTTILKRAVSAIVLWMIMGGLTMTTIMQAAEKQEFHGALTASGRSPEIPESLDLYGWLVGSWELDVLHYWVDVSARHMKGEVHFEWVLEGRAVQDVWIIPRRAERQNLEKTNTYGTTLRVWDPSIQAWRVTWINPVTGYSSRLLGRRSGKDIVQVGAHPDGTPIRWIFSEITADSFRWTGESLNLDGKTWKLEGDFRARRIPQQ